MTNRAPQTGGVGFQHRYTFGDYGNADYEIVLQGYFGKFLRIGPDNNNEADGNGGTGDLARWIVEWQGHYVVKFKNTKTNKYLRIYNGRVDVGGGGGKWTKFEIKPNGENNYKFESVELDGKYPAIWDGGRVGVGTGGKFTEFSVWSDGRELPSGIDDFRRPFTFHSGTPTNDVVLQTLFGKSLRIKQEGSTEADGNGGTGGLARWTVEPVEHSNERDPVFKFQNESNENYLRIDGNTIDVSGVASSSGTTFIVKSAAHRAANAFMFELGENTDGNDNRIVGTGQYPNISGDGDVGIGSGGDSRIFFAWTEGTGSEEEEEEDDMASDSGSTFKGDECKEPERKPKSELPVGQDTVAEAAPLKFTSNKNTSNSNEISPPSLAKNSCGCCIVL